SPSRAACFVRRSQGSGGPSDRCRTRPHRRHAKCPQRDRQRRSERHSMSYVEAEATPADIAMETEHRAKDILFKVGELLRRGAELHARYSSIQAQDVRSPDLPPLQTAMDDTNRLVGALGRLRTELLDGLPIILDARGQIDVVAEKLAKDASLVERV